MRESRTRSVTDPSGGAANSGGSFCVEGALAGASGGEATAVRQSEVR